MRPTPILTVPLFLIALCHSGCSPRPDTVVGNERLIRGPGGLGTTYQSGEAPSQDTYMAPDSASFNRTLLVGQFGTFQAKIFMAVSSWTIPDTTLAGFQVDSVFFLMEQDTLRNLPLSMSLLLAQTTQSWDTTTVTWPGPPEGLPLGATSFDFIGPLRINLGTGTFTLIKQWAQNPGLLPGLVLRSSGAAMAAGFKTGTGAFHVKYKYTNGAVTDSGYAVTRATQDFYLNSPVTPAPTGADTALMLGGGYEAAVAVKVPIPASSPGYSLNEGRLVLNVSSTFPAVDGSTFGTTGVSVRIEAFRIRNDWTEGVTDLQSLDWDALPISILFDRAPVAGDSLSVPIPDFIVREWTADPSSNNGVLVTIKSANLNPGLFVSSRESSVPPVFRLAYTSPPPWRF